MNYLEFENLEKQLTTNLLELSDIPDKKLKKIYKYYNHKGYHNILLLESINLISTIFMIFFILVLVKCIDYKGLGEIDKQDDLYLGEYINFNHMLDKSLFNISFIMIFGLYTILRIITLVDELKQYHEIKIFFQEKLKLENQELTYLTWSEVAKRLEDYYGINIYHINSKILRKENFMIPIFDSRINKFIFSKLMEWNLIFCIFNVISAHFNNTDIVIENNLIPTEDKDEQFLVDETEKEKNQRIYFNNSAHIKKKCLKNLLILSFLTYLFMPFLFIYILFFTFLKYGERYYHKPIKITYRQWSLNSFWKMRYYNELEHELDLRMEISSQYAKEYLDFFKSPIFSTIVKFIVLVASSCFITLLILSIYNENILLNLHITNNKHVLWYLGLLGSIIAIGRNMSRNKKIKKTDQDLAFQKLSLYNPFLHRKKINLVEDDVEKKKIIKKDYSYQIQTLLKECFSVLAVPFCLVYIANYLDSIIDTIEENLYYDDILGFICHEANFRNINQKSDFKKIYSFKEFRNKYPLWGNHIEIYQLGDNSILNDKTNLQEEKENKYQESIFHKTLDSEISII